MSLNLITDRTQADVDRYYYFRNKIWWDLTTEEKEEFARGLKGSYNYTDFKRVENAVSYLSNLLNKYGYVNVVKLSSEETFTPEYVRDKKEIITYLDNIATLQKVYYNSNWVGKLPTIEEWLDYNGANTIEEILANIEVLIENMKQVFVYSGVAGAGQERIWQQRFRRPVSEIEIYTLTNIIPDPSFENNLWDGTNNNSTYSITEKAYGGRSLYFATGTTIVANIEIPRPIVGHKYYGRRYIKSNGDNQPADSRFEVWGGDGENKNWVYAWNRGYHPDWEFNSSIHEIKSVDYVDRTIIRCFNVGTTADTWVDGLMLIDLTECFGAGKEPNVFWCDRNIPYFEGTKTIEVKKPIGLNYKVFGNAEQATRSGINKLLSFAEGETSYFSSISNTYVNDTNYFKAVPLKDNWIHVECDCTDSSITTERYINSFINKDKVPELKPSTRYTIIVEFRNVNKVSINTPFNFGATHENQIGAIWERGNWAISAGDIVEGAKIIRNNYYTSATITKNDLLRNFHTIRKGDKFSYDYRISLVEGAVTEYDYEPYGVMPSPNYPSTVYGLGSRTRNIFDINNEYIILGKEIKEVVVKNNSIRIYPNGDFGTGAWISILYKIKDITNDIGKTGRIKMNFKHTGEVAPRYILGVCNEDGSKRTQIGTASVESGVETACVIPEITDEKKYLCVWLYLSGGAIVKKDDYTEFSNIIATIDDTNTNYIPHKAIEIKQKIGYNLVNTVVGKAGNLEIKRNSDGTITVNGKLDNFTTLSMTNEKKRYFKKGIYSIIVENDKNKILSGDFYYYYKNTNYSRIYLWKENVQVKVQEFTDDFMFDVFTLYLNAGTYDNVTYKFQIVKGSEYKPYIPFIEVNKYIDLTNHEPLMKVGDVADYIDYENSRIVRNIGKAIFDGSSDEAWYYVSDSGGYMYIPKEYIILPHKRAGYGLCSHFIFSKSKTEYGYFMLGNNYAFMLWTGFDNVTDWRSWLASNPITIWYELAEPYYEEIDLPSIQKIPGEYSLTAYDEYLDGRVEKE